LLEFNKTTFRDDLVYEAQNADNARTLVIWFWYQTLWSLCSRLYDYQ